jgi:hypothetical protein
MKDGFCVRGVRVCLLFAFIITCGACTANHGTTERSPEVNRAFKNYEVWPGYTYYHNGWENNPYAIVGIRAPYKLVSSQKLWKQIDADKTSIQRLVDALFEDYQLYPYGAYILAPNGEEIGVLYSSISNVSIKMTAEMSVMIIFDTAYLSR